MKYSTLVLSALVAFTVIPTRADNFVTITPTGATAATVANRWAIGSNLVGLGYIDGNSGFGGATATNFFTITGSLIGPTGDPNGFISYVPTGAATPQGSVGNAMTPNSYAGLTYVAENLSLIGPLSFYTIHHRTSGDYLALIQPGVPTVSDQKPMSVPGGPLTGGATGYFGLSYAAPDAGGWGANLFYYLRTNGLGETVFGSLVPALLSGPTDRWNLGAGRGFTDLAFTTTDVGFGFGPNQFYYLRLDPLTQTTFFGRLNPLTGVATDIQNLGGVYRTLVFTPTNVGYGANLFYSIGRVGQTITLAPIPSHTACDASFTFVYPVSTSGLPVTVGVSGPATIFGNLITLTGATGTVTLTASQAGDTNFAPAPNVAQSFAVTACVAPPPPPPPALTPQTITFAAVPDRGLCDPTFTVTPTASSGLPVALVVSSGPATISGYTVTVTGVGTVTLTASQAGNGTYASATPVSRTFAAAKCAATVTLTNLTNIYFGSYYNALEWIVVATSPPGLNVIVTNNGNLTAPAAVGSFTVVGTIDSPIYAGSTTATLVISADARVSQTVSFGSPAITDHVFGDAPFTLNPYSSSGLPTSLAVKSGPATVLGNTVTMTGAGTVVLEVSQSGNIFTTLYAALSQSFVVAKATVPIALSALTQTFDGLAKSVVAVTTVPGLIVNLTYNGSATAPSAAGSYAVHATINDANYQGVADATMTIAAVVVVPPIVVPPPTTVVPPTTTVVPPPTPVVVVAPVAQSVTFNSSVTGFTINTPVSLNATTSSGLPVTFTVISGNATVTGSTLLATGPGIVVVRATQPGNGSFAPVSTDLSFGSPQKAAQSIALNLGDVAVTSGPLTLAATSSAGLPISYTVSGPAQLSGNVLTLTGASGTVTVSASQAGNDSYNAAPSVSRTFLVSAIGQQVYLGKIGADTFALIVSADNATGTFLTRLAATGEAIVANFSINPDGSFRSAATNPARTVSGTVRNGVVNGSIAELGLNFTGTVAAPTGSTAAMAGVYRARALGVSSGETYVVVGAAGEAFGVSTMPSGVSSGTGSISSTGAVNIVTSSGTIVANVAPSTGIISGTLTTNGASSAFAGLSDSIRRTDRLVNLSSRLRVVSGDATRTAIAGFVVTGGGTKRVLVRAVGPGLSGFGISDTLTNPKLQLYSGNTLIAENDDWTSNSEMSTATASVGAFQLASGSRDSALIANLAAGAYTAMVTGAGGNGVALIEVYDADTSSPITSQLVNISSRAFVDAGEATLLAGFVVTGNSPKQVLVRGIGPGLTQFGLTGALLDPQVRVYSNGTLVASNDNWETGNTIAQMTAGFATAGAFALPAGSKDAALIVTLAPGAYSAQVSGVAGATGVALVEIYQLP